MILSTAKGLNPEVYNLIKPVVFALASAAMNLNALDFAERAVLQGVNGYFDAADLMDFARLAVLTGHLDDESLAEATRAFHATTVFFVEVRRILEAAFTESFEIAEILMALILILILIFRPQGLFGSREPSFLTVKRNT